MFFSDLVHSHVILKWDRNLYIEFELFHRHISQKFVLNIFLF